MVGYCKQQAVPWDVSHIRIIATTLPYKKNTCMQLTVLKFVLCFCPIICHYVVPTTRIALER